MALWLAAVAIGAAFAALQYGSSLRDQARGALLLAALRAVAVTGLLALLLDAPVGPARPPAPRVVLDASLSWTRADPEAWSAALAEARRVGGDSLWLAGDALRPWTPGAVPGDLRSRAAPAVERAIAEARPIVLVTDGRLDDPAALDGLPLGSRVVVMPRVGASGAAVDAAIDEIGAPAAAAAGDTITIRVAVRGAGAPTPAGRLRVRLGGRETAPTPTPPLPPWGAHVALSRVRVDAPVGAVVVAVVIEVPGDREPRNDTLAHVVRVERGEGAVFASSAPDLDARAALAVLRGATARPVRAYFRLTPTSWRREGDYAPVDESVVRGALRGAPLAVLHGDTALFGRARDVVGGGTPLALLPGPVVADGAATIPPQVDEWYPSGAPASPIADAITGIAWDSLPPVGSGGAPAPPASPAAPRTGSWVALEARRGRQGRARPVVTGHDAGGRTVVVHATGLAAWRARSGAAGAAYDALLGSAFDWLAAGTAGTAGGRRAAALATLAVRAGDSLRWRVPAGTSAVATITPSDGAGRVDTVRLDAGPAASVTTAPLQRAGRYVVRVGGSVAPLVVAASRELVPRPPAVASGARGAGAAPGRAPALREYGLAYVLVVLALCAEWLLRRRHGLR